MASLRLWLSIVVAVAAGATAGATLSAVSPVWVARGVVAAVGVAAVLVCGGALRATTTGPRAVPRSWLVALGLLAAVRGAVAVAPADRTSRPMPWTEGRRGGASGIRVFEVQGASTPNGRCLVRVAPVAATGRARGSRPFARGLRLSAPLRVCPCADGDRLAVAVGSITSVGSPPLPGARGPGWGERGIVLRSEAVWWIGHRGGPLARPAAWVARLRQRAWQASRGDDAAAFVVATSLGMRQALAPEHVDDLRAAGLGHLIAVSGLHVGIAAWLVVHAVLRVCATARVRPVWGLLAAWCTVVGYVALTGASPSAVRAGAMACLAGLGDAVGRPAHGVVSLAATSAMMLLAYPGWVFDPGFQLSVVAMAVLVTAPAGAGVLLTTWRVTWAIVPVALLHFGGVGAYALLTNLVAVPLATLWILPVGLAGALATPWLGPDALVPAAWGAAAVLDLARWVAAWPPVDAAGLAGVSALSLLLSTALALGAGRRRAWVRRVRRAAIPPLAAAATVACVILGAHRSNDENPAPPSRWVAIGTARQFALVLPGPSASACIVGSTLSASRWPALLRALGVRHVVRIAPGRPGIPPSAPHLHALREALVRRDMMDRRRSPGRCIRPPRRAVLDALRRCQRAQARPDGRAVALRDTHGALHCYVAGRWESMQ